MTFRWRSSSMLTTTGRLCRIDQKRLLMTYFWRRGWSTHPAIPLFARYFSNSKLFLLFCRISVVQGWLGVGTHCWCHLPDAEWHLCFHWLKANDLGRNIMARSLTWMSPGPHPIASQPRILKGLFRRRSWWRRSPSLLKTYVFIYCKLGLAYRDNSAI